MSIGFFQFSPAVLSYRYIVLNFLILYCISILYSYKIVN